MYLECCSSLWPIHLLPSLWPFPLRFRGGLTAALGCNLALGPSAISAEIQIWPIRLSLGLSPIIPTPIERSVTSLTTVAHC